MRGRVVGTWGGGEGQPGAALHRLEMHLAPPVDMQVLLQRAQTDLRFSFANQLQGLQDCRSMDHTVARTAKTEGARIQVAEHPEGQWGAWISFPKTVGRRAGE